jgi:Kef-type K+ transport system membrane component KefB
MIGRITDRSTHRRIGAIAVYCAMIAAATAAYFVVRHYGDALVAKNPATSSGGSGSGGDWFLHLLVALLAIIVLGRILGVLFAYVHQPPVIGEVVAGIILGPSFLGAHLSGLILPVSVAPYLNAVAQLGVVLYMFMVGLELDPSVLKNRTGAIIATSHAGIVLPFILGAVSALVLYPHVSSGDVSFTSFSLFMGVAMSITAFPVLARILSDYKLMRTRLGVHALSCAAVGDFTAWCLLALVVGIVKAEAGAGIFVVIEALVYIALMFLAVRPIVARLISRLEPGRHSTGVFAAVFVFLLLSATATEAIGIHAIFGAFLAGAVIPHDSMVARDLVRQLRGVVNIVLLPAFFAFAGMRTRIDLLDSWMLWLFFLLLLAVATIGKFGGSYAAARLTGLGHRGSTMLGALMNTRGLMELIVLSVGLDLGVVSLKLYTLMVLMALATTALTSPVLRLTKRRATPAEVQDLLTDLEPQADIPD